MVSTADLDDHTAALAAVQAEIVACQRCPRLVAYREEVARTKRRAFRDQEYWGRPVPSFGDPNARLVIIGLAPAAHGGNRTGRPFTGDASGNWLYRALYRAGFANQPTSLHRDDGLQLFDAYITAVCHCVPPNNRPTPDELAACSGYLARELALLPRVRVLLCLGAVAFETTLRVMRARGYDWPVAVANDDEMPERRPRFQHGGEYRWRTSPPGLPPAPVLLASYPPSQRNTQTGLLTEAMFDAVFAHARALIAEVEGGASSGYETKQ